MIHKIKDPVPAYPCYGIFADYDANAPCTEVHFLVATEELAQEVRTLLNEDPRAYNNLAFVDGWEFCKTFRYRESLTTNREEIFTNLEDLQKSEHLEIDPGEEDDE